MRKWSFKGALLAALMITSIMALAIPLLSIGTVQAALTSHVPIYINGNSGFTGPDPVNGGGSGTISDPYIIENYIISASTANGIDLRNTTAYFVVRNCVVENGGTNYNGIYLDNVINGEIDNNTCGVDNHGIYLLDSSNNIISSNICYNNGWSGIHLWGAFTNTLIRNTCKDDNDAGIDLWNSSNNNTISNNTCDNNQHEGIYLNLSENNSLAGNTCENNNLRGIAIVNNSDNNTIENNTVEYNTNGILLGTSNNNRIYHNNIINNTPQAHDDGTNYWDNGLPSGGNYWSDWTSPDSNHDGIVDNPYAILGGNNQDRYPLTTIQQPTPSAPVGGIAFPANKLALLAPYIILAALIAIASVSAAVYWIRYKA